MFTTRTTHSTNCFRKAFFSGALFAKLREANPDAHVYADIGHTAYGLVGSRIVRTCAYVYMGGVLVAFHLTCTIALYNVWGSGVCTYSWSAVLAVFTMILVQVRGLKDVGFIAVVCAIAIIVPCIIVCETLIENGVEPGRKSPLFSDATFTKQGVGAMDMVFAYAGQVIFIELMAEMKKPKEY